MKNKLSFFEIVALVLLILFFIFFFTCVKPEDPKKIWVPGHYEIVYDKMTE